MDNVGARHFDKNPLGGKLSNYPAPNKPVDSFAVRGVIFGESALLGSAEMAGVRCPDQFAFIFPLIGDMLRQFDLEGPLVRERPSLNLAYDIVEIWHLRTLLFVGHTSASRGTS